MYLGIYDNFDVNNPATWPVDFGRELSPDEIAYYGPSMIETVAVAQYRAAQAQAQGLVQLNNTDVFVTPEYAAENAAMQVIHDTQVAETAKNYAFSNVEVEPVKAVQQSSPIQTAQPTQQTTQENIQVISTQTGALNMTPVQQEIYAYAHTLPFGSTVANEKIASQKLAATAKLKKWSAADIGVALGFSAGQVVQYFKDHGIEFASSGMSAGAIVPIVAAIGAYFLLG